MSGCCRICDKTCSGIVNKCLNGRPGTVQKAGQVCLWFIELELADKLVVGFVEYCSEVKLHQWAWLREVGSMYCHEH